MRARDTFGVTLRRLVPIICLSAACAGNPDPVSPESVPPPTPSDTRPTLPPPPPPSPPPVAPTELVPDDEFTSRTLEELNRDSPLEPAFFSLDSEELDDGARQRVQVNAEVLLQNPTWMVTIEGHCDERGTPEYNLGLGERRALAAQQYLVELGLDPTRIRFVSYGKEFPFDLGSDEVAWAANRRAHFVITSR